MQKMAPQEVPEGRPATTFTKLCRRCSAQVETAATHCPNCGTPYRKSRVPWRAVAIASALAVVLLLAGLAVAKHSRDHHEQVAAAAKRRETVAAAASASAAAAAAETRRRAAVAAAAATQRATTAEKAQRAAYVTQLSAAIKANASQQVASGTLTGPILGADCMATNGGVDDLTSQTGAYSCIAYYKKTAGGAETGDQYTGLINWDTGEYAFETGVVPRLLNRVVR